MADAWTSGDSYEGYVGRWSRLLAPAFVAWARVPARGLALDVGCGTGAVSQALLERGCAVVGVDPSPAFVRSAQRRFASDPRAVFEAGDARRLRFADESFDAVASGLVLNFVPEPERAAREMARVAKRGGVVAAYVWDYAGGMEMMRRFWDAAIELDVRAKPADEAVRFALCNPAGLEGLFRAGGLRDVETTAIDQPTVFRNFDDLWSPFLAGQGPAGAYLTGLPQKQRDELRDRMRARIPLRPDGSIALMARAWAVRGVR